MPVLRIDHAGDPRLEPYRDLPEPELVRARGLFIAEGRLVVERLIQERRYAIQSILLGAAAARALEPALGALAPSVPVYVCDRSVFAGVTGHDFHRGCLALVQRPAPLAPASILLGARRVVVLEAVANADNVGSVFRNAAAFAVDALLLSPTCCDPFYRKAIRTSLGAVLRVPFARVAEGAAAWPAALSELRSLGLSLVALSARQPAQDIGEFAASARTARVALLVGNEGAGLSEAALELADHRVRIPMRPEVDSLNLSVAVGIALHRLAAD